MPFGDIYANCEKGFLGECDCKIYENIAAYPLRDNQLVAMGFL